ncbi:MAG: hypothetical protein K2J99_12220 [Lachnospiraceae bacterium]|nr:hypothetical protein [Lachnospiraceae bacterium]
MKKITVLLTITCMLLSGCGVKMSMAEQGVNIESSVGLFNQHSSYFDHYSSEKDETICKIKGRLHQAADDRNGIITYVTAQDGIGSMTITGSVNCTKGGLRLVYMSQDGTETLISDGTERNINAQIDVAEGEGSICFVSDGKSSVCEFDIKMEAGEGVTFANIMEEGESTEGIETLDTPTKPERLENLEDIEDVNLDEIEDNWPENICYSGDGVYADPMSVSFEVDKPMTLSVSCITTGGELRLKIVDNNSFGETVYFDESNPAGTYTVDIDKKGTYQVLIYAKYHKGSVEIMPMEE